MSGSGYVTVNPIGGSSYTDTLTDDPDTNFYNVSGTLTYSYTETWEYTWVPDDEEPPESQDYAIPGTALLDFSATMMGLTESANGTASATMGGNSEGATASAGPNGMGGVSFTETGTGSKDLWVVVTLNAASGTFNLTYSANVDSGGRALVAHFQFQRNQFTLQFIKITSPTGGTVTVGTNFTVSGWWVAGRGGTTNDYRINIEARHTENAPLYGAWHLKDQIGPPLNANGTWASDPIQITAPGTIEIRATLWFWNGTAWVTGAGMTHSVVVTAIDP